MRIKGEGRHGGEYLICTIQSISNGWFITICAFSHSISAQSNFALGAVVNATFGSITELTFYITALLQGHRVGNKCYEEVVKAALTGTLLGCILFIPVSAYEGRMCRFSLNILISFVAASFHYEI